MDEGKLHEKRSRGEKADVVLTNPLFMEAVAHVSDTALKQFKNSSPGEAGTDARAVAHMKLRVLEDVLTYLTKAMKGGERAVTDLIKK